MSKFKPDEIIFALTNSCNLNCQHCFVPQKNQNLDIEAAIKFLDTCQNSTIEKIGFSGGEPFLYIDFLNSVIKHCVQKDFLFDRIMTNGVWWNTESELTEKLNILYQAGFDGKIGLSWDSFHGQSLNKIFIFIKTVQKNFGPQSLEIQSVISKNDENLFLPKIKELADLLGCNINPADEENFLEKNKSGCLLLQNQDFIIPIYRTNQSFLGDDPRAWTSKRWFKNDYCIGPGHILFIHPDGNIAPCCGFANENPALFIGTIKDSFTQVMEEAQKNPMIKIAYEKGLRKLCAKVKKYKKIHNLNYKNKTNDLCAFCDFVCKNNIM